MNRNVTVLGIRIILIGLYLLFAGLLWWRYGITTDLEAAKYIEAAHELSVGNFEFVRSHYKAFVSYIIFLLPATLAGKVQLSVIPQIGLTIIASNEIYNLIKKESNHVKLALIGMSVYLFNFFIQCWTTTLFSEGFFIPVSTILLTQALKKEATSKNFLIIIALSVIVIFARPQGILFALPTLIYFLKKSKLVSGFISNIFLFSLILATFTYILIHSVNCEYTYRPIAESSIICGFPQTKKVHLDTNDNCTILDAHRLIIREYGLLHDIKLFGKKAISLFTFTRSYYSTWHNWLVGVNYIFLVLSVIPLYSNRNSLSESFLYQIISLNIILTGITYNEWHGRYLAALMPILIMLATKGLRILYTKKSRHN